MQNFLVDTNIWLERLLSQEKEKEVEKFLSVIPSENLFISDFSLHSIGVILDRLNKLGTFSKFLNDLFIEGKVNYLKTDPIDNFRIINLINNHFFDFDDAYQVNISELYNLKIVTFDKDFRKSGFKSFTPIEAVHEYLNISY